MEKRPEKRNYYEILHVSRDAPAEIIRGSYRTLMQKLGHHPDLGGWLARTEH
jgi:DnaJ-class molecular chaperone